MADHGKLFHVWYSFRIYISLYGPDWVIRLVQENLPNISVRSSFQAHLLLLSKTFSHDRRRSFPFEKKNNTNRQTNASISLAALVIKFWLMYPSNLFSNKQEKDANMSFFAVQISWHHFFFQWIQILVYQHLSYFNHLSCQQVKSN